MDTPVRGTGARLWVHAPSLPESLLEEYFSGFGIVLDVYCPRDAQCVTFFRQRDGAEGGKPRRWGRARCSLWPRMRAHAL